MEVGFIGLGAMGGAMAANLARAGHRVKGWARSGASGVADSGRSGVDGLEMVGALDEVVQGDALVTMLPDDPVIRAVLLEPGVLARARPGLVHVVTSTISVAFAGELAAAHARAGLGYVAAPVLGRPDVAREGGLNILAAGRPDAIERVRPLLAVLGRKVWDLGEEPARANAAKIAANMMITMAIEAMAEAVVLTEANGLPRARFFELILGTLFAGRSYESYAGKIAAGDYEPGFKARLGLKDLGLATAAAEAAGRSLPMLEAVRGRMAAAVEAGLGERDWSVMADATIRGAH